MNNIAPGTLITINKRIYRVKQIGHKTWMCTDLIHAEVGPVMALTSPVEGYFEGRETSICVLKALVGQTILNVAFMKFVPLHQQLEIIS